MPELSRDGQQLVQQASTRHGFSQDAVSSVLAALINSGGSMAQFSHHELGGMGQWSRGGMIMIGDMFNNNLKYRVDALCRDLSDQVQSQQMHVGFAASSQYQSQGDGGGMPLAPNGFFAPDPNAFGGTWWPEELGQPASAGAQNDMRYAYFPDRRRLAVSAFGEIAVYDTGEHNIGGFSQQQGGDQSINFSSQFGRVSLNTLRRVLPSEVVSPPAYAGGGDQGIVQNPPERPSHVSASSGGDVFASIERLATLRERGILSDNEFAAKKAELLSRI